MRSLIPALLFLSLLATTLTHGLPGLLVLLLITSAFLKWRWLVIASGLGLLLVALWNAGPFAFFLTISVLSFLLFLFLLRRPART